YAEKANLRFRDTVEPQRSSVNLPNGQDMKILGECEFKLQMSEWTGMVMATVLELHTDFDIVLGLSWHRQWKPLPDRDTLDLSVNAPRGVLRIVHKWGEPLML